MAKTPEPGEMLRGERATYTIDSILIRGKFSFSCEAHDETGTKVFLKFYKTPGPLNAWFKDYLDYERELNRRLSQDPQLSQKTVPALEVFNGRLFKPSEGKSLSYETHVQVFPFIKGHLTLKDLMENGFEGKKLEWEDRLLVATVTLAAMRDLHKAGIIHSDLKPENFQVAKEKTFQGALKRPLIVDMDFSVLADRQAPWHGDRNLGYVGSPGYFSPEHLTGATPLPASDVFTMSEILCELLCGKHPFESVFGEKEEYEKRILSGNTDFGSGPMTFLNGKQEPELEKALRKALSPDPRERKTMEELHEAVANVLNGTSAKSGTSTGGGLRKIKAEETRIKSDTSTGGGSDKIKKERMETESGSGHALLLTGVEGTVRYGIGGKVSRPSIKRICGEAEARFASYATQFVLDTDGTNWFASPGDAPCKTHRNGIPLLERTRLSDGDELAIDVPRCSGGSEPHAKMKVAIA